MFSNIGIINEITSFFVNILDTDIINLPNNKNIGWNTLYFCFSNKIKYICNSTSSGKLKIEKFPYEDYYVEITTELVSIKTTTRNTSAAAKSFDDSYNVYSYTIFTGVEPQSKWHQKEAEKKAKKKLKGDKEDLDDMM